MLEAFDTIYFRTRIDATFLGMDEKNLICPWVKMCGYKANQFKKDCIE